MTAVRIEVPPGVASPVWLAHVVRNAVQRALADPVEAARLRVEAEPEETQALSAMQRGKHAKGNDVDANASCGRPPF